MTELHQAAASGDADLVEEMLQQNKYNPNQRDVDWNNKTPLHWAAERGQAEIVRVLLEHGARPCLRTDSGWTPAHYAAECGRLQVLKMLHAFHAALDREDCCGDKPVHIARIYGHMECVRFLERAETEHQEYLRAALQAGLPVYDTDTEWVEQRQGVECQKWAKNCKELQPVTKSKLKT